MLSQIKIYSFADLLKGDLTNVGNWVVASIRTSIAWPHKVETVEFRGKKIILGPQTTSPGPEGSTFVRYPFVAVNLASGVPFDEGREIISHFLSSFAWVESGGIFVESWSGGSRLNPVGESRSSSVISNYFELDYLPDTLDKRARWALAFYREGMALERLNLAYAILSFFKILNIIADNGRKQSAWINENISRFGGNNYIKQEIVRRSNELKADGVEDIGSYLYKSCRCAIAHAGVGPTIDPENRNDLERLSKDLPLIRAMAAHLIEYEFGIKSPATIYREHLYELSGFKIIFGDDLINRIIRGEVIEEPFDVDVPMINVKISGKNPYPPLSNLLPVDVSLERETIILVFQSQDKRGMIRLKLNFLEERLNFEVFDDLYYTDDGSADAADSVSEVSKFFRDYFLNGRLQIYNAQTGELIGRKDAFIPTNLRFDFKASEQEIEHWKELAVQRRQNPNSGKNYELPWFDTYDIRLSLSFSLKGII